MYRSYITPCNTDVEYFCVTSVQIRSNKVSSHSFLSHLADRLGHYSDSLASSRQPIVHQVYLHHFRLYVCCFAPSDSILTKPTTPNDVRAYRYYASESFLKYSNSIVLIRGCNTIDLLFVEVNLMSELKNCLYSLLYSAVLTKLYVKIVKKSS